MSDTPKTVEEMLFSLITSVSAETENYIESKGRLIRLPMQSRAESILKRIDALRRADMEAVKQSIRDEYCLDEAQHIIVMKAVDKAREERLNG